MADLCWSMTTDYTRAPDAIRFDVASSPIIYQPSGSASITYTLVDNTGYQWMPAKDGKLTGITGLEGLSPLQLVRQSLEAHNTAPILDSHGVCSHEDTAWPRGSLQEMAHQIGRYAGAGLYYTYAGSGVAAAVGTPAADRDAEEAELAGWTRFDGANLYGASFRGATLHQTSFAGAEMGLVTLEGADLEDVCLARARLGVTVLLQPKRVEQVCGADRLQEPFCYAYPMQTQTVTVTMSANTSGSPIYQTRVDINWAFGPAQIDWTLNADMSVWFGHPFPTAHWLPHRHGGWEQGFRMYHETEEARAAATRWREASRAPPENPTTTLSPDTILWYQCPVPFDATAAAGGASCSTVVSGDPDAPD